MQTIAKLADRLDMSAQEAVETLRKLRIEVESIETEINDATCDILIDIDEDPSNLDKLLKKLEKEDEERRKRTERLRKANEKKRAAAAKKPAAKKSAKAPEDTSEDKAKRARKTKKEETEEEAPEELVEQPALEVAPVDVVPEAVVEIVPEAAPEVPPAPVEPPKPRVFAEIMQEPEVKPVPEQHVHGTSHGTGEDMAESGFTEGGQAPGEEQGVPVGATARLNEQERPVTVRRVEDDWEKRRGSAKPLPTPDPDVVAEVIRKAHERSQKKTAKVARTTPAAGRSKEEEPASQAPAAGAGQSRSGWKGGVTGKTARKKQKRAERLRGMDDDMRREAAAAVRGVQSAALPGMAKKRRKKREREEVMTSGEERGGVIEVEDRVTVERLADLLGIPVNDLILDLMDENVLATKNQVLELELVRRLADAHGFEVSLVIPEEENILAEEPDDPDLLRPRAPVVTVMGHVDHGKTSLLDHIRRAKVAAAEAGGITQHIAAYEVELPTGRVTFLDTPGHEAFTQMRARGAQATDIVVLVVAADDGVKPQTIEAIDHARAANVPIVVAINKCDKPDAQPDRVRQELTRFDLLDEAWGGKTIMRNISAMSGEGVDELLEMLALQSELMELKANPEKRARGVVIESELSKGHGPVAWVLVQSGTLRPGDVFLSGSTFGRVRTMMNSRGEHLESARPSQPVLVTGFSETPNAGDDFVAAPEERVVRTVAEKRAAIERQKRGPAVKHMTLEDFHARMAGVERKTLNIIIKADTQGSVDVLQSSFAKLGNEEVSVSIVHAGVGGINSSDVLLASASDAVVLGFHVTAHPKVQKLAEEEGVDIRLYLIIYEAIEQVRHALEGLLAPESREVITGHAEIRQVFRSSALGSIAGCYQLDGVTERGAQARLVRDGVVVYDGRIGSLRRNKDDVRSVAAGYECGIKLERFDDVNVNDIIESYRVESVAKTLA